MQKRKAQGLVRSLLLPTSLCPRRNPARWPLPLIPVCSLHLQLCPLAVVKVEAQPFLDRGC